MVSELEVPRSRGASEAGARDGRGRPLLEAPLRALLRGITAEAPELAHVNVDRILVIAGSARRSARASMRPLTFGGEPPRFARGDERKPRIQIRGREMRYELCLRPTYFRRTPPGERLRILVHELWHIAPSADGTLDPMRRHTEANREESERFAREVAAKVAPHLDLGILELDAEFRAPMWIERPPSSIPPGMEARLVYDESDLFLGVVRQKPG